MIKEGETVVYLVTYDVIGCALIWHQRTSAGMRCNLFAALLHNCCTVAMIIIVITINIH